MTDNTVSEREQSPPRSRPIKNVPSDHLRKCLGCGVIFDAYNYVCPVCNETDQSGGSES